MRRGAVAVVAVLAAILLQASVLDSLPFPGGSPPDLVLLVVVTLALSSSPVGGAVLGFCVGLATDIAPPASHLLGLDALVFCLVGYACGRMRGPLERSAWMPLGGIAIGVFVGETLYALAGMVFGDPDITWRSAQYVVPVAVVYDILLSPFVLAGIAYLSGTAKGAAPAALLTGKELAPAWGGPAPAFGSVRDSKSGGTPRLKLSGGGLTAQPHGAGGARRPQSAKLRLRGGVAGSAAAGIAGRVSPSRPAPAVNLHLAASRNRGGLTGGSARPMGGSALQAAFSTAGTGPRPGAASRLPGKTFSRGAPRAAGNGHRPGGASRLPGKTFSRGAPRAAASTAHRPSPAQLRLGNRRGLTSRHRGDGLVGGGALSGGTASRARRPGGLAPGKTFRAPRRGKHPVGSAVRFLTRRKPGGTGLTMGAGRGPRFRSSSPWAQRRGWRARLGRRRTSWRPSGGRTGGLT